MKSVFLSDSTMLDNLTNEAKSSSNENVSENDYIMVECDCDSFDEDDEDYDYCDDALSEGIQLEQHLDLTEDMILEEAGQPSIQQILDEAHKSASQVVYVTEDEQEPTLDSSSRFQESLPPELPKEPTATTTTTTAKEDSTEAAPTDITDVAPNGAATPMPNLGRMSNKKRRKKMKLLKKAAAAAKAATALSGEAPMSAANSSTNTKKASSSAKSRPMSSRYYNKRVANIAVACATETLSSYKAELQTKSNSPNSVHWTADLPKHEVWISHAGRSISSSFIWNVMGGCLSYHVQLSQLFTCVGVLSWAAISVVHLCGDLDPSWSKTTADPSCSWCSLFNVFCVIGPPLADFEHPRMPSPVAASPFLPWLYTTITSKPPTIAKIHKNLQKFKNEPVLPNSQKKKKNESYHVTYNVKILLQPLALDLTKKPRKISIAVTIKYHRTNL